jgi:hypothetical protein
MLFLILCNIGIEDLCNLAIFSNSTLFNFFNECVERDAMNYKDKDVAMYLLYGSIVHTRSTLRSVT